MVQGQGDVVEVEKRLRVLEDVEEIKRLRADYWWRITNKLWNGLEELFTDDVHFYSLGTVKAQNRDELVRALKATAEKRGPIPRGHMPVIDMTGPTSATGRWIICVQTAGADGAIEDNIGYYLDEYQRGTDGRWRIKSFEIEYFRRHGR